MCEIKLFKEFLDECFKVDVLDYKFNCLTKPGDNYASIMKAVDVKIADGKRTQNNNEEVRIILNIF